MYQLLYSFLLLFVEFTEFTIIIIIIIIVIIIIIIIIIAQLVGGAFAVEAIAAAERHPKFTVCKPEVLLWRCLRH